MPESPDSPFSGIFVSYRRDDSSGHAGRLFDKLVARFGNDRIFMDIDTIEPGEDFVTVIESAVASCDILIAVIGRNWLSGRSGATGRLNDPNDFVRVEIAAALARNIRVIPVLVQKATMPTRQDLPPDLANLARRNAVELSDLRWQNDVEQLMCVMDRVLTKRQEEKAEEVARQAGEQRQSGEKEKREQPVKVEKQRPAAAAEEKFCAEEEEQSQQAEYHETEPVVFQPPSNAILLAVPVRRLKLYVISAGLALLAVVAVVWLLWQRPTREQPTATQNPTFADVPVEQPVTPGPVIRNQIGMELVYLPPGSFIMGSNAESRALPKHRVTITNGFYIGKYEVTQAQWRAVMGNNPSHSIGENLPVESVSWNDAVDFVTKLSARNDRYTYRLPSEAEWEYACRAGNLGEYAGDADAMGWYGHHGEDDTDHLHPVGKKQPNAFGLFDMHGNVSEWCQDELHDSYEGAPADGSAWVSNSTTSWRIRRGGSWNEPKHLGGSGDRLYAKPNERLWVYGLRVVAVPKT
jgi:formylglycine-generating enzyme required for sulfatase activity